MIITVGLPGRIFVSWLPVLSWRQLENIVCAVLTNLRFVGVYFRKYIDMVKSWNTGVKSRMNFHADFYICLPQPEPHRPKHLTKPVIQQCLQVYEFPFVFHAASHTFIADCFVIIKNSFWFARCQIRVHIFYVFVQSNNSLIYTVCSSFLLLPIMSRIKV